MTRVLIVYGTRPEAIKLAPLVHELRKRRQCKLAVCLTGQHREMCEQVNRFFGIQADYDLKLMKPNQSLVEFLAGALAALQECIEKEKPDIVVVQGDTRTVLAACIVGYYNKVRIAHVEAGLRSYDPYSPFPEEGNRVAASRFAWLHFAPTRTAALNLQKEGITGRVSVVGNTVVDALNIGRERMRIAPYREQAEAHFRDLDKSSRIVLITGHRRESFGAGFREICASICRLAHDYLNVQFVYPVHLNPNVRKPVFEMLSNKPNVFLIDPLEYPLMIWLLEKCYLVLTDSGGIQEEAPSFGKPTLIMREKTERTEGIEAGVARLVGTRAEGIYCGVKQLLEDEDSYRLMAKTANPYGDGMASHRIADILLAMDGDEQMGRSCSGSKQGPMLTLSRPS